MLNQQAIPTVENNFKAGLKTEFTGLNFPEHAATDTSNCVYSIIGDVSRRGGINFEANWIAQPINTPSIAKSSFRWLNAGGDGESQLLVVQMGGTLFFYVSSDATVLEPLSSTILGTQVFLNQYLASGSSANPALLECQYAAGNGYLFVFHPNCDPFYVIYEPGSQTVTANVINLTIRDLSGIIEPNVADNFRPTSLSNEHLYNLLNQGWTQGSGWSGVSSFGPTQGIPLSVANPSGSMSLTLSSQSSAAVIVPGDVVSLVLAQCAGTGSNPHNNGVVVLTGTVNTYTSPNMTLTITENSNPALNATGQWGGGNFSFFATSVTLTLVNQGFINTWFSDFNDYPSNADVWWIYKDTTDAFNPTSTIGNVQPSTTPAPKGVFTLNPFIQNRSLTSSVSSLTTISTLKRPSTGAFYQGRVFYAGVNDSFLPSGDAPYTTWTENIYFSQIIVDQTDFGQCYQTNDPTSQTLFSLLPSDGGVITIQGCGNIFKLFALRYGLLVFAANGIWFISGSTGIGFTADDYTIIKISNIQTISGTSFIDVQGYPFFWNQEGIYQVTPTSQAGSAHSPDIQLSVNNLVIGDIATFYNDIPLFSRNYARGDYDMLNYIVQWAYKSTPETGLVDRYNFDSILCYNVITKAFYPYAVNTGVGLVSVPSWINDIKYIQNPGGADTAPPPILKYMTNTAQYITFSEENDFTRYVDFYNYTNAGFNYTSYFVTGYNMPGQFLRKFQTPYIYLFSRNPDDSQCIIQAIWDYVNNANTGRESTRQIVTMNANRIYRKIRLRGRGLAVQFKVTSMPGEPFDLMGWSVWNEVNQGI